MLGTQIVVVGAPPPPYLSLVALSLLMACSAGNGGVCAGAWTHAAAHGPTPVPCLRLRILLTLPMMVSQYQRWGMALPFRRTCHPILARDSLIRHRNTPMVHQGHNARSRIWSVCLFLSALPSGWWCCSAGWYRVVLDHPSICGCSVALQGGTRPSVHLWL